MSELPQELKYTKSHEWVKLADDDTVLVGITDHAQCQLGDLVFVELPEENKAVTQGDDVVVLESVKTAADAYAPASGEVLEINHALESQPELINQDPYGNGWLYRLKISDKAQIDALMNAQGYQQFVDEE